MNYKWIALSNTTLGTLMASLDRNIILIALPSIASEFNVSLFTLVWITIGYWLVTACMLLTFGRLADIFGRIKLYNLGFILFTVGSALCFISQNGEQLVIYRIIQAIGAAFLFSNSAAIISDVFPSGERGRALGINQIAIVIGSVIGLVLGGLLTFYLGWRSIFWMNIPIGIFATLWAYSKLKEFGVTKREKIDWAGNFTFTIGLLLLLLGITFGSFQIIDLTNFIMFTFGGIILLFIFYKIEKNHSYPMLDLNLFKNPSFFASNIAIFLNALARGAFTFVFVFYLQGPIMNLNPLEAGIFLLPVSLGLAIFAPLSGWLFDKFSLGFIPHLGLIVSAIGFLLLLQIGRDTLFSDLVLPLSLIGAGLGIFASPNRAIIMNSVPPDRRGIAAGTSTTLVMLGSAFSIGFIFLIFVQILPLGFIESFFISDNSILDTNDKYNNSMFYDKFLFSIHLIFLLSAGIMIISVIIQILLIKSNDL